MPHHPLLPFMVMVRYYSPAPDPTSGLLDIVLTPGPGGGIHRNADSTDTPFTPSTPANCTATATSTNTNDILSAPADFSCLHSACNLNSRIGLVDHLQIHRMETCETVPGAPT
ncbi:unnamed protein product [Schistocephalus solidus]|uniref:C2H2-type domain-containing protein n=1 Tax=Schistocephalus solidus TaxID=70667 RepID=A0A183SVZ5_SCHSO|nr:unnamed protein product [Schistocephalus solidus]